MSVVQCKICGKSFSIRPFFLRIGWGKYCSRACHHAGMRKRFKVHCSTCGEEIFRTRKMLKSSKSGKYFCSKSCQTRWRNVLFSGARHLNWKGGANICRRVILNNKKVPRICRLCVLQDVRVLAVHHVDHNRRNNKSSNLIWLCHNCHVLIHRDRVEEQKLVAALV